MTRKHHMPPPSLPESDAGKAALVAMMIAMVLMILAAVGVMVYVVCAELPWVFPVALILYGAGYFIQKKWKPL